MAADDEYAQRARALEERSRAVGPYEAPEVFSNINIGTVPTRHVPEQTPTNTTNLSADELVEHARSHILQANQTAGPASQRHFLAATAKLLLAQELRSTMDVKADESDVKDDGMTPREVAEAMMKLPPERDWVDVSPQFDRSVVIAYLAVALIVFALGVCAGWWAALS